jgi:hypothetical protein
MNRPTAAVAADFIQGGIAMHKFILTSTNPVFVTSHDGGFMTSNDVMGLLGEAHRFSTGEDNCEGLRYSYCVTNSQDMSKTLTLAAWEFVSPATMDKVLWDFSAEDALGNRVHKLNPYWLGRVCIDLGVTADEVEHPLDDSVEFPNYLF